MPGKGDQQERPVPTPTRVEPAVAASKEASGKSKATEPPPKRVQPAPKGKVADKKGGKKVKHKKVQRKAKTRMCMKAKSKKVQQKVKGRKTTGSKADSTKTEKGKAPAPAPAPAPADAISTEPAAPVQAVTQPTAVKASAPPPPPARRPTETKLAVQSEEPSREQTPVAVKTELHDGIRAILNRGNTSDGLDLETLQGLLKEAAATPSPSTQSGGKPKRNRDKATRNRNMRFYRSLESASA